MNWTGYRLQITISPLCSASTRDRTRISFSWKFRPQLGKPLSYRPETYEKLRRIAAEYLRSERAGHTLQPTALLHEAFLRVLKRPDYSWNNETHVIAFAARAMRRILVSYGVARTRDKRGGPSVIRLPLDEALDFCAERDLNLVAVDEALEELESEDPRQAQIVELRFFAGLSCR